MAVVHNLQFAENLLAHGRFRIYQNDLMERDGISKFLTPTPQKDIGDKKSLSLTFFAIIVPVGICSTFTTLPPFPCPRSWSFLRSSFLRPSFLTALDWRSSFARVLDSVACIALRRPVAGLSASNVGSNTNPGAGPPSPSGGGRLLPGAGAGRVAIGLTAAGAGEPSSSTGSTRALKLRLVRSGAEGGTYPSAGVTIIGVWRASSRLVFRESERVEDCGGQGPLYFKSWQPCDQSIHSHVNRTYSISVLTFYGQDVDSETIPKTLGALLACYLSWSAVSGVGGAWTI